MLTSLENLAGQPDPFEQRAAILLMIVGPHSGFSLSEILDMKAAEEKTLGHMYWGYAGSLCHPVRVQDFARKARVDSEQCPLLVMIETKTPYVSKMVGRLQNWSTDGIVFEPLASAATLIGCTAALTCRNLKRWVSQLDINRYVVAHGSCAGSPLGHYLRYQINKACAVRAPLEQTVDARMVTTIAVADIVEPYCVYLRD